MTLPRILCLFLFTLLVTPSIAVTVYECIDSGGNSSFRDRCPPGTTLKGEKKLHGQSDSGPDLEETSLASPVTLYTVQDCDACDLVRNQLKSRDIPFTEKDISEDVNVQQELQNAAGELKVPMVLVGDNMLTGYNKHALDTTLDTAGYPPK